MHKANTFKTKPKPKSYLILTHPFKTGQKYSELVVENIFENFSFENSDKLELNNKVKCQKQISNDW
jgi:hypothetical protein